MLGGCISIQYNNAKNGKNASKIGNVTQVTQVMYPQKPKDGKLEKRNRDKANDSFVFLQDAKNKKSPSLRKGKSNRITKIMETASPGSMNSSQVEPKKEAEQAWTKFGGKRKATSKVE